MNLEEKYRRIQGIVSARGRKGFRTTLPMLVKQVQILNNNCSLNKAKALVQQTIGVGFLEEFGGNCVRVPDLDDLVVVDGVDYKSFLSGKTIERLNEVGFGGGSLDFVLNELLNLKEKGGD